MPPCSLKSHNTSYGPGNPASLQLQQYAANSTVIGNFTTSNGAPVYDILNTETAGEFGPVVLQDYTFLDEIQHFDRERVPERVVCAKGAGAFGYFTSTNDFSNYTQATIFTTVGKRTPLAARMCRFSGQTGSPDTVRDLRGFSLKFYTDQGNWDLVGSSFASFWLRDPLRFTSLMHASMRNPTTNLYDPTMFWDFIGNSPETANMLINIFTDRGIPLSYRTMNGYSTDVFVLSQANGSYVFAKFIWDTNQGLVNIPDSIAAQLAGTDPDFHTRDLYNNIALGNFPSWNLSAQILTRQQLTQFPWNPFDPTKEWPVRLIFRMPLGVIVLNENPKNYFAQVEQLAFNPASLIPGIQPSIDKVLQGRLFAYSDAQMHRLGSNYDLLPVNSPVDQVANRQRDGQGRSGGNMGGAPNYSPNSFNGPLGGNVLFKRSPFPVTGLVESYNTTAQSNFAEASIIWAQVLTNEDRTAIVNNIAASIANIPSFLQLRNLNNFYYIGSDMAERIAGLLNISFTPPPPVIPTLATPIPTQLVYPI
ncbi:hypothetical protein GE061_004017 [Apolygus lucorum]|uniref:Catalase core domain-containing protein n=1 Tax=Apolygus lucorum TaxID=248454 RepID=A0A8S9WZG4_APOLU|nr:hypothetical protein GE061_004017 [Apolygus lucorum]